MAYCPWCGTKDVEQTGGDKKEYPHPTAQGVLEKFIMILCKKCKWSSNIAGATQNAG